MTSWSLVDEPTKDDSPGDKSSGDRCDKEKEPCGREPGGLESDDACAGLMVEPAMRSWITRRRGEEIVGTRGVAWLARQLATVAVLSQNALARAWKEHRADDRRQG